MSSSIRVIREDGLIKHVVTGRRYSRFSPARIVAVNNVFRPPNPVQMRNLSLLPGDLKEVMRTLQGIPYARTIEVSWRSDDCFCVFVTLRSQGDGSVRNSALRQQGPIADLIMRVFDWHGIEVQLLQTDDKYLMHEDSAVQPVH